MENWLCSTLWFWSPRMYLISSISIRSPSINAFRLPTILNFYHSNQIWCLKFSRSKHKTMTHSSNNKSSIETLLQKNFGHLWFSVFGNQKSYLVEDVYSMARIEKATKEDPEYVKRKYDWKQWVRKHGNKYLTTPEEFWDLIQSNLTRQQ